MLDKLNAALSFHQNALRIRAQRQELIAANIANADTPNYKARDVDFRAALGKALAGNAAENVTAATTSPQHIAAEPMNTSASGMLSGDTLYRQMVQGSVDGNTVDMDVERNQFADNAVRYEASLTMLNGQIKKLLTAIQGQ